MEEENEKLNKDDIFNFLCSIVIHCTSIGVSAE